jgi:protein phosphatase
VALTTVAHLALHYGRWNLRIDPRDVPRILERAEWFYARADEAVAAQSRAHPLLAGATTALTLTFSAGDELFVAHVGHSRAYLFREGALTLLTSDHTVERHLAESRRLAPIERRAEDLGHILTDAIGAGGGRTGVEVERFRLRNGDCVLLCTNGLTDAVDEDRIAEVLALRRQPQQQCEMLTDLAREQGGDDNATVVLAQYRIPPA